MICHSDYVTENPMEPPVYSPFCVNCGQRLRTGHNSMTPPQCVGKSEKPLGTTFKARPTMDVVDISHCSGDRRASLLFMFCDAVSAEYGPKGSVVWNRYEF